jgi:membrane protein
MKKQDPDKETFIQRTLTWVDIPFSGHSFFLNKLHIFVRILIITIKEFNKNELNIRASALTYTILLSLVPILAMSTAVVKGLGGGNQLRQVVNSYVDTLERTTPSTRETIIPTFSEDKHISQAPEKAPQPKQDASITIHLRSATNQIFDYVDKTNFATLGTFGVLGILFSAILVLGNIELAMNTIWQVSSGRTILRKITDYLTFLVLMPFSINFGFAANAVLKNDALLGKIMAFFPAVWVQTALLLGPLFFITLTLFLIYIFFPHTNVRPIPAFIGALFAATLWFITQNLYIGLQIGVSNYNAIYGSFATLPLFLVWMFLGWVFILGGAQLAFACQQHSSYQLKNEDYSPLEQLSAAFDILTTTLDAYTCKKELHQEELPEYCPAYTTRLIGRTLEQLLSAHILVTTQKGLLLPCAPADQIQYQEITKAILGKTFPQTKGGKTASVLLEQADPFLHMNFNESKQHES